MRVCEACYCPPWMLVRSYTSREARWATVHLAQSMRPSGQVAHFGLGANKSERAKRTDLIVEGGGDAFWSMRQRLSRRTETSGIGIAVLGHGTCRSVRGARTVLGYGTTLSSSVVELVVYSLQNFPCIQTLYIFSCRFRFTMRRRSTPSCWIEKSGCDSSLSGSGCERMGWIAPALGVGCFEASSDSESSDCRVSSRLGVAVLDVGSWDNSGGVAGVADGPGSESDWSSFSSTIFTAMCSLDAAGAREPVKRSASSSTGHIHHLSLQYCYTIKNTYRARRSILAFCRRECRSCRRAGVRP